MPELDPTELLRQAMAPLQRELSLVHELLERERRLQRDVTGRLVAPIDAVFDLLEETGSTLERQATALQTAGEALAETAALMRRQAELFERTVGGLRQPVELVKSTTGTRERER